MSDTLASLQIELTGKMDQLTASLSSVQSQLQLVVNNAKSATSATQEIGSKGGASFSSLAREVEETTLGVRLFEAATGTARNSLLGMAEDAGAVGSVLGDVGGELLAAGAALGVLTAGVERSLEAFAVGEVSMARVQAVIQATGNAAGLSSEEIEDFALGLAQHTLYSKEQVEDASAVMMTFGAVSGDAFKRAMSDAADMASLFGGDISNSARALGRAFEDPTNGLTALRRAGIIFTDDQKDVIQGFLDAGDKAGAYGAIMDVIEGKVGGVADAMGNTLSGATKQAKNALEELFEQMGGDIAQTTGLTDKVKSLASALFDLAASQKASSQQVNQQLADAQWKADQDQNPLSSELGQFGSTLADYDKKVATPTPVSPAPTIKTPDLDDYNQKLRDSAALAGEDARQRAIDNALLEASSKAWKDGVTSINANNTVAGESLHLTDDQITNITKWTGASYDGTAARKADTSEAKKQQEQSDALTKSLNEALIATQKQGDDIGLTDVQKATNDAAEAVQKYAAQYPLLNGQLSDTQKATENLIATTMVQTAAHKDLYAMYEATLTPLEQYQQTMTNIAGLTPFANTPQQIEAVQRAIDNANDAINKFKPLFDSVAQEVDSDFEKMFSGLMDGSVNSLKSFSSIFLSTFESMLAKMATMAIMNPVIVPIVQELGTSLGISTTGINSMITKLGGGVPSAASGSSSDAVDGAADASSASTSSILSLASSVEKLSNTSILGGSGFSDSLDNFGSKYFGIGTSYDDYDPITGAESTGVDGGVSGLATLGNAAGGLAGGYLGNKVFGDTGIAGDLASGAGALGGAALATGTGAIGTAIGTSLGSFAGPVGAAIGAFAATGLTSAIEGLFGGKVSVKGEATDLSFASNAVMDETGATSGDKYSAANRSASDGITAFAQQVNAMLTSIAGASIQNNLTVSTAADQSFFTIWGNTKTAITSTSQGLHDLTGQLADLYAATGKSSADVANLKTAIGHIDFSNPTQALSDINFALNFDSLGKAATVVTAVDTEVANLTATFATYDATATRLGLSITTLNAAQQAQMGLLQSSYTQSTNASFLDGILPGYSDFEKSSETYGTAMKDAVTLGLSAQQISTITLEHNIEVQSLLQSNNAAYKQQISDANSLVSTYGNLSTSWTTLIASLTTGSDSTLSSTAQLDALRSQVESVGAQAQTGDTTAQSQLLTLIPEFISASQSVNGYNASYAADQQLALNYASAAKSVADQQLTVQQSILNTANSALGLLTTIAGTGSSGNANDKLVAAIKAGYTGLTNDQINAIFDSAGLTVAPGGGARTTALNQTANSGINTSLNDVFHALGVPGFATGGQIGLAGGGKPGVDSVPLIAMPGEFIMRAKAASALGAPTLNYMNSTGRLPSNDNSAGISALSDKLDRLTDVVYATGTITADHLQAIRGATSSSAATANRALNRAAS